MKKIVIVIVVGFMMCFWMTSCFTTQNVLLSNQEIRDYYVGKTKQQLIQMMGPPTRETTDGGDGSILVYESNGGSTTKTTTTKVTDDYYISRNKTTNQENYSWFYLNSKGICTSVKTNCLSKQAKAYDEKRTFLLVFSSMVVGGSLIAWIALGCP